MDTSISKFVDQIKKNYCSAYFVEGSFPGNGLARFGDVLFVMKSDGGWLVRVL